MAKIAKLVIDKNIGDPTVNEIITGKKEKTVSAEDVQAFLDDNTDADILEITINSNGGDTDHGKRIYRMLKAQRDAGKEVHTISKKANSICSVIFLAGKERAIEKTSPFVIHEPFINPRTLEVFDKLTSDTLQLITDDVENETNEILNIYVTELNLDDEKKAEIAELMKVDTDLGADKALSYGFATKVIEGSSDASKPAAAAYTPRIAALIKDNQISDMDKKEFKAAIDKVSSDLKSFKDSLFKKFNLNEDGTPKSTTTQNSTSTLKDGSTFYFAEDSLSDGIKVFSDEAMTTPLAAGDYNLSDGGTFSVSEDGTVSGLAAAENLKTENEALKAQIADMTAKLNEAKAENTKVVNQVKVISDQVTKLAAFVPGDEKKVDKGDGGNGDDFASKAKQASQERRRLNF